LAVDQEQLIRGLLQLAESLSSGLPLEVRLTDLCRTTVQLLGCDRSSIFLREGQYYRAKYNHGNPPDLAPRFPQFRVSLRDPLISRAMETHSSVVVNDAQHSPLMNAQTARRARIQSIVVAPLFDDRGDALGFITAEYNEHLGVFTEAMSTLVLGFAKFAELACLADRHAAERKRAEEALRQSEERFRVLIENSSDIIVVVDAKGTVVYASPSIEPVLGYKPAEVVGRNTSELIVPADLSRAIRDFGQAIVTKDVVIPNAFRVRHKNGSERILEGVGKNLLDHPGVAGFIMNVRDVTERERAEAEQAALLEIARDIAGVVDLNEILSRVHQRVATLLPCDRIVTYYFDAMRHTYRALAWHGVPARLEPDTVALEFRSHEPVAERLLAGETVLINDIAAQSLVPLAILTHFGLRAVLLVPLVVRGRSMGALAALNAESGRCFAPHQVHLLEGIAQQVGVAIEAAELSRAQGEEKAVAEALARVGQEIMSSLSKPSVLSRLCQLTTEVLSCDRGSTWLWDAREEAFVPVASHGDSPEQWETIRLLRFDRSALATQLEAMERDGLAHVTGADLPESLVKVGFAAHGITLSMLVPLRRGSELLGFHAADYHGRGEALGERDLRILRGIGQLASLALENVRLVEALEQANRLKSEFVAAISHELRTPLNIIMGYNDLLLEEVFGSLTPQQAESLESMRRSSCELLELITATLDLSRLEAGRLPLDLAVIHLPDLLQQIDAEIREAREDKPQVAFSWQIAPGLAPIKTDGVKLKVVLKNLISNALKFTDHGNVTVSVTPHDGGVAITVTDTGIGITAESQEIIFEPFRQVDGSLTRRYGGVGLGLYVVHRLLDLLGGTVQVESDVGHGSTFHVWLPARDRSSDL
jgi:two-component system sensor histidine kinase BarA